MIKVLFVCHGNICRSAMAEYIFKDIISKRGLEDSYSCFSRAVSREEIGNDIYPPAKRCLNAHGVRYGRHYADQITLKDYQEADVIFLMDKSNFFYLSRLLKDSEGKVKPLLTDKEVADPWYTGDFEQTYIDLVEGIERFLEAAE